MLPSATSSCPGADHFDLIDPESEAWPTIVGALTTPR